MRIDTSLAENVMLLTPFSADAQDELTKNFVSTYNEKFGETPNQFAADAYDCVYAIYEVCKSQNVTADMIAQEIGEKLKTGFTDSAFKFNGLTGSDMSWATTGAVSKEPKGMIIKNGAYVGM